MLAPLDLVSAYAWRRVAFTTYALSLSFFEAVILDALVRGGGREAVILADVQGVRASLGEQGARRVGKDYEVEPVAVSGGVFHPKLSVLSAGEECHLLAGSGNLTFGGWGGNREVLEHLHPSFAADAIEDAADFFDLLPVTERIRHCAEEECAAIAAALRGSIQGKPRNGNIRLFHSLDKSISEHLVQTADGLGGAVRIVAAAPFWDGGSAIDDLCHRLGLDHVFVHAHSHGCVEGSAGSNWPAGCHSSVQAIRLEVMEAQGSRRLHAKVFEVICKRGRIVLSGSANGTATALSAERNVEAWVVRIERERTAGWKFSACDPPELQAALEKPESDEQALGVLRAVLEGDEVSGKVLTPTMKGTVSVFRSTELGLQLLGEANLSAEATFRIKAPGLEEQSWRGERLVIRVQSKEGKQAEGFVSVASFVDITRRTGSVGRRLFAMLAGTETPADVAAIMSWFYEDPQRLAGTAPEAISGGSENASDPDESSIMITVAELDGEYADAFRASAGKDTAANRSWVRFISHVFAALREKRGPFGRAGTGRKGEDEEDEPAENGSEPEGEDPAIERSMEIFGRLFDRLVSPESSSRHIMMAFDLTQYVCERMQPDAARVQAWIEGLIRALVKIGVPPERQNDVAGAVLILLGMEPDPRGYRWARDCLLHVGVDMCGKAPSMEGVQGFGSILHQTDGFEASWERLQDIRTFAEQVRSYLHALKESKPSVDYGDLAREAPEEWPVLQAAFASEYARKRIVVLTQWQEFCPRCQISLPTGELYRLQAIGIATAKGCCHRIVIWPGE